MLVARLDPNHPREVDRHGRRDVGDAETLAAYELVRAEALVERDEEALQARQAALGEREFVGGERFSVADITATVTVDFARVVRVKPGDQHPHLLRWRAAMAERPAMAL